MSRKAMRVMLSFSPKRRQGMEFSSVSAASTCCFTVFHFSACMPCASKAWGDMDVDASSKNSCWSFSSKTALFHPFSHFPNLFLHPAKQRALESRSPPPLGVQQRIQSNFPHRPPRQSFGPSCALGAAHTWPHLSAMAFAISSATFSHFLPSFHIFSHPFTSFLPLFDMFLPM